jgi:two-component system sensor histidine kinase DesK
VNKILTTLLLICIAGAYLVLPPLLWVARPVTATAALLGFMAFTSLAFLLIQVDAVWLWIYVCIVASMGTMSRPITFLMIGIIVAAQLIVITATGQFWNYWYAVALTASISIMMFAFAQQIRAIRHLRDAQSEIARLAVVDERARFARDMHDVLGHSLTVVTVKAELARRLVDADPGKAITEIEDVERLSRAALADLRAAVAGYREMSLATELAAAQAALAAADITPHLPAHTDAVAPELRELFSWVLRESVTNVIRHSRARNCWVALERRSIRIGDDGVGGADIGASGQGLAGIAARAEAAGATLEVTDSEDGGTLLTVTGARR